MVLVGRILLAQKWSSITTRRFYAGLLLVVMRAYLYLCPNKTSSFLSNLRPAPLYLKETVMDKELQDRILRILHPPVEKPIFTEDYLITREIVTYIRGLKKRGNISRLFCPDATKGAQRSQRVEVVCADCGKVLETRMSRSEVESYIRGKRDNCWRCPVCRDKAYVEIRAKQEAREKQERAYILQNTCRYIDKYLNPANKWKPDVNTRTRIANISDTMVDTDMIRRHIQDMPYDDFLKTPYWIAISTHVRKKNNFTCEMCGATDVALHIHHPDYSFHGEELQNIGRLKCLCEDCHEKFHSTYGE